MPPSEESEKCPSGPVFPLERFLMNHGATIAAVIPWRRSTDEHELWMRTIGLDAEEVDAGLWITFWD
jgi:hypothetical protein